MEFESLSVLEKQLDDFFVYCKDAVYRMEQDMLPITFSDLTDEDLQSCALRLNSYFDFELKSAIGIHGLPTRIDGVGVMYVSDEGDVQGAEVVSDGDYLIGDLDCACAFVVPTIRSVVDSENGTICQDEMILSPMIMLKNATYYTGLTESGEFEAIHDLSNFDIGIPLAHYFSITVNQH